MSRLADFRRRFALAALVGGGLSTGLALAVVQFNGVIDVQPNGEWSGAEANAVQTNHTGFGDQRLTPGGFPGSELDELFVRVDANYLYIGITGNLEQNGNAHIILLDTIPGGQNVLKTEIAPIATELPCSYNAPPGAVQGLGQALTRDDGGTPDDTTDDVTSRDGASVGTQLDAGFAPDYAITYDTSGGTLSVTQYTLGDPAVPLGQWDDPSTGQPGCAPSPSSVEALDYFATRVFRGSVAVNSGQGVLSGGTNPNGWLFAFNNTGKQGVTGASDTPPPAPGSGLPGDPRSQTTGLEARIALADLGLTTPLVSTVTIRVAVVLTSADGFVSNQTLPGIGAGTEVSSLGYRPDFTSVPGNQYATVTRTVAQFGAPSGAIDGTNIVADFGVANVVASQDTVTGFGDRNCLTTTPGSELDELMLRTDGSYLYVGISGNLETNSNAQILLLDVRPGGQNVLKTEIAPDSQNEGCSGNGPPGAVQGLGQALATNASTGATERSSDTTATVLDAGFEPETAISFDTTGGTLYVTQYDLAGEPIGIWNDPLTPEGGLGDCTESPIETLDVFAMRTYRGQIGLGVSGGVLTGGTNPNGSLYAYNNSGVAGVTGTAIAAPGSGLTGDPRTQTTGFEAKISLLDLGFAPEELPLAGPLQVKAAVLLTSPTGFVSNQTLPGIGAGTNPANLGNCPNFASIGGNQYVTVNLTPAAFSPVIDGQNLVAEFGTAAIVASQNTVTGFGDAAEVFVSDCDQQLQNGSELDRILAREGPSPDTNAPALQIAIAGNLERNGNNIIIFLDTIPGGEGLTTPLDGNAGRVSGNAGDRIPLDADYAVLINNDANNMYVDLIDLQADLSTFIGFDEVSGGDGILNNGGTPALDWRASISNGNLLGVNASPADDPQPANALTATTGIELNIPLSAIGNPPDGTPICMFVMLAGGGGYLSNQFLPSVPDGGRSNYGDGPTDLVAEGYTACLPMTIGASCNNPRFDADGDGDVDLDDFGAFQACYTGNGGSPDSPLYAPECECFDWGGLIKNGNINAEDFGAFQFCASRAGVAANPACDDAP